MSNVWKKEFRKKDKILPNKIAIEYCNELYNITNKKVIAKVSAYNVNFKDMNENSVVFNMIKSNPLFDSNNIQDFLGEVEGNDKFTYEMYLTGVNTKNYKYRFCFIEYGITGYPLKIAIDTDIANGLEKSSVVECVNEEEYKKLLIEILNSKKLTDVIEGLMAINSEKNSLA